ncbi:unnamed protein product, partial [Nesidiocoris tenuis]
MNASDHQKARHRLWGGGVCVRLRVYEKALEGLHRRIRVSMAVRPFLCPRNGPLEGGMRASDQGVCLFMRPTRRQGASFGRVAIPPIGVSRKSMGRRFLLTRINRYNARLGHNARVGSPLHPPIEWISAHCRLVSLPRFPNNCHIVIQIGLKCTCLSHKVSSHLHQRDSFYCYPYGRGLQLGMRKIGRPKAEMVVMYRLLFHHSPELSWTKAIKILRTYITYFRWVFK